jgi:GT2 family glycosyltransferase
MKDIAVIIPGMNTRNYLKGCLESLARTEWRGYTHEVIYVDNGSKDDSLKMVASEFPYVRVLANPRNLGFCRGANQGAAAANARFLLHLNNDTLLEPDSIPLLADFLEQTPDAAVVGSRLLNADGTEQWSARRFPAWYHAFLGRRTLFGRLFPNARVVRHYLYKDQLDGGQPFVVDWVPTPCMMVRADVFQELAGFPEDFYYWHEAIFCHRLRHGHGKVYLEPRSRVTHFEGKGGGPRPYPVRRWHIIDFHQGAYRFACEFYRLGRFHPARWLTAAGLWCRAALLLTANRLNSPREKA